MQWVPIQVRNFDATTPVRFMKRATVQPVTFPEDESLDVGLDTRTAVAMVDYRYDVPFKFTGKIDKLTFHLEAEQHAESYLSR